MINDGMGIALDDVWCVLMCDRMTMLHRDVSYFSHNFYGVLPDSEIQQCHNIMGK